MSDRYFGRTTCPLSPGDKVLPMECNGPCHKHYEGEVMSVFGRRVTVQFPNEPLRQFDREELWLCPPATAPVEEQRVGFRLEQRREWRR